MRFRAGSRPIWTGSWPNLPGPESAGRSSPLVGSQSGIRCSCAVSSTDGHELASHGYGHQLVHEVDARPVPCRSDPRQIGARGCGRGWRSKAIARPHFSIGPRNPWAFDVLEETGHRYSSSIYPVKHDLYGVPDAPRFPHRPGHGRLIEIPMTTLQLGRRNMPIAGGGYFRLIPYSVYRLALAAIQPTRAEAGHLLLSSMGDRCRAAARLWRWASCRGFDTT